MVSRKVKIVVDEWRRFWQSWLAHGNANENNSFQKFTRHASAAALCHATAWLSGRFHIGVPFEFLDMKSSLFRKYDRWFNRSVKGTIKGFTAREKVVARAFAFRGYKAGRLSVKQT
jgi:hypothetical protein